MTTDNNTIKLGHDALSAIFQQHSQRRNAPVADLLQTSEASSRRIALVEQLAHDRLACQALQLAEDLRPWTQAVANGLAARVHSVKRSSTWWKSGAWLTAGLTCAIAVAVLVSHRHLPTKTVTDVFFANHFDTVSTSGDGSKNQRRPDERAFRGSFDPPFERSLFKSRFEGQDHSQETA